MQLLTSCSEQLYCLCVQTGCLVVTRSECLHPDPEYLPEYTIYWMQETLSPQLRVSCIIHSIAQIYMEAETSIHRGLIVVAMQHSKQDPHGWNQRCNQSACQLARKQTSLSSLQSKRAKFLRQVHEITALNTQEHTEVHSDTTPSKLVIFFFFFFFYNPKYTGIQ